MKHSSLVKSMLILAVMVIISAVSVSAQNKSNVYQFNPIEKYKLEVMDERLDLTADQLNKAKAIEIECNKKLEEAKDNTAAKKVYKWKDAEYKKILSAAQYKVYEKEKQDIVDEAQFRWMKEFATVVEL